MSNEPRDPSVILKELGEVVASPDGVKIYPLNGKTEMDLTTLEGMDHWVHKAGLVQAAAGKATSLRIFELQLEYYRATGIAARTFANVTDL